MSNLLKNLLIALGLAIIIFVGYIVFVRDRESNEYLSDGANPSSPVAQMETEQLLGLLNELKSLDVRGDVFSDPLFLSLKDFRQDLGDEPTGRSNPFAPTTR